MAELRLASALKWLWHIRNHHREGIHWLEQGLSVEAQGRGAAPLTPERFSLRAKAAGAAGCHYARLRAMSWMRSRS